MLINYEMAIKNNGTFTYIKFIMFTYILYFVSEKKYTFQNDQKKKIATILKVIAFITYN